MTTPSQDGRALQPITEQSWRVLRSRVCGGLGGRAKAASKLSGATADASQQRSREAKGRLRLAAEAGQEGGVTAAAWGSLCDTITTTLCWCRGSLCLLRISPELPVPARSGHSRRPRLWLSPSRPRDVTLQPSRRRYRSSGSTAPAAAAFASTALGFFRRRRLSRRRRQR